MPFPFHLCSSSPQAEPIRVVVTGAAGQIAYSLLYMVAKGNVFGDKQKVILHLLDIPQCMGVLEGVVMELNDCAFPLLVDIVPTDDPAVAFKVRRSTETVIRGLFRSLAPSNYT